MQWRPSTDSNPHDSTTREETEEKEVKKIGDNGTTKCLLIPGLLVFSAVEKKFPGGRGAESNWTLSADSGSVSVCFVCVVYLATYGL